MLQRAEAKARSRAARRRRFTLLLPATVAILWSTANLVAARHDRLGELDAGVMRHASDHAQVILWGVLFVLVPLAYAVKPDPLPHAVLLSLLAGPFLTPLVFGRGGWRIWQTLIVVAVTLLILGAQRERARETA